MVTKNKVIFYTAFVFLCFINLNQASGFQCSYLFTVEPKKKEITLQIQTFYQDLLQNQKKSHQLDHHFKIVQKWHLLVNL